MYGHELASYDGPVFSGRDSQARSVFYGYYDQFVNELLADSQTVYPGSVHGSAPGCGPGGSTRTEARRGFTDIPPPSPAAGAAYTSAIATGYSHGLYIE